MTDNQIVRPDGWIEYEKQKPRLGQLVLVYRDIELRQAYTTVWTEESDLYADWNAITHWMPFEFPTPPKSDLEIFMEQNGLGPEDMRDDNKYPTEIS